MRVPFIGIFFLLLPILEIAGIILVGNTIGLWATLGLILGSSVFGVLLLRWNAISMAKQFQQATNPDKHQQSAQQPSQRDLIVAPMRSLGAILLITPGFICKSLGIAFLLPPLQRLLWSALGRKMTVFRTQSSGGFQYSNRPNSTKSGPTIVDLGEDDFERHPNNNSPWYDNENGNDQKRID